jgi:hypothetical protein
MEPSSWKVTVVTAGKIYSGTVSIAGSLERRTIALLNSASKSIHYTQTTGLHNPEGFLRLDEVVLKAGMVQETLDYVSIRKSEIVLAYDEFVRMGSEFEKKRFEQGNLTAGSQKVTILTISRAGYWYRLKGTINQFANRLAGKDPFIPVTGVQLERFSTKTNTRGVSQLSLPFVALNCRFIESIQGEE